MSASGAGAFRRAFTTNVAPQCKTFSRALEIEKLKAPLFRGPERGGDTNDWCITQEWSSHIFKDVSLVRRVHVMFAIRYQKTAAEAISSLEQNNSIDCKSLNRMMLFSILE